MARLIKKLVVWTLLGFFVWWFGIPFAKQIFELSNREVERVRRERLGLSGEANTTPDTNQQSVTDFSVQLTFPMAPEQLARDTSKEIKS